MDTEPRVFVVDDDVNLVATIERVLHSSGFIVETFTSPASFLQRLPYDGPACLVLDMRMPGMSGLDVQEAIATKAMAMTTVFLSGASAVPEAATAMRHGAVDFLVKPIDATELLDAVSRGLSAAAQRLRQRQSEDQVSQRLARLTQRERQVCELVARGLLNKQIASDLGTSEKTIKVHRGRVMRKLEVDSVAALVWLLARGSIAQSD